MGLEVLVNSSNYPAGLPILEREFQCHRLWAAPEPRTLLAEVGPRVEVLATSPARPADAALLATLPRLRLIAHFGIGTDMLDLDTARRRGIAVTNTPGVQTECTADYAMGLILMTLRRMAEGDRFVRAGRWGTGRFLGTSVKLGGRTLGIYGLGRIGSAVAKRAEPFGMRIVYHNRRPRPDAPYPYHGSLLELARAADVLLVTAPGGADTARSVTAEVLDALGPRGYLVNVGRGSIVDEPALIRALTEGRIAGAGLDVYADEPRVPPELCALENVVLLPHVASSTVETLTAMVELQAANIRAFFAGQPLLTPVP